MDDPSSKNANPRTIVQIIDELTKDDPSTNSEKKSSQEKNPPVPKVIIATPSQGSSPRNLLKTRVKSIKELKDQIKETQNTQRTARSGNSARRGARGISGDDVMPSTQLLNDPSPTRKKKAFLPTTLQQLTGKSLDIEHEKTYTEDEVWELVKSCNPILHEFGKKHNLELEDLEVFAACMERLAINPELITEYANPANDKPKSKGLVQKFIAYCLGDPHEQHLERMNKKYERMGNGTEAEHYKAMLLELIKTTADQAEGKQTNRSVIADTHAALQNQAIADQTNQTRLAYLGLIVTLFTAAGGWAFGVVGQFINPGNCTN